MSYVSSVKIIVKCDIAFNQIQHWGYRKGPPTSFCHLLKSTYDLRDTPPPSPHYWSLQIYGRLTRSSQQVALL